MAPEAVRIVEEPLQRVTGALPFTVGRAVTATEMVLLLLHPLVVPCIVYVVLIKGFAVTLLPDVGLKPVTGNQL